LGLNGELMPWDGGIDALDRCVLLRRNAPYRRFFGTICMRPRKTLLDQFSSFLQFQGDRSSGWLTDPRLAKGMSLALAQDSAACEADWVRLWHGLRTPRAIDHLTAFLQEPCYWGSVKVSRQVGAASGLFGLSDLFQSAIGICPRILASFDPELSSNLRAYAEMVFRSQLKDLLRKQREVDICTDWGLLHKVSQKRLTDALVAQGLGQEGGADRGILLAWLCFREIYAPSSGSSRRLQDPDGESWAAIGQLYDSQRLAQDAPAATVVQLEAWLRRSALAVRRFLYPGQLSSDVTRGESEESWLDSMTDGADEPIAQLIAEEAQQARSAQQQDLDRCLDGAIAALPEDQRQLLSAYYGEGLTQQEIAEQFGIKQYQVSRRLTALRKGLIEPVLAWRMAAIGAQSGGKSDLHTQPDSALLSTIGAALDGWLADRYARAIGLG
jgi:RNA polymerase sigma factor (sigma-70 family)